MFDFPQRRARLTRETLVTLRVIVLEADLELDRLQEVALLGLIAVLEEFYRQLVGVRKLAGQGSLGIPLTLARTPATEIFDILKVSPKGYCCSFGGSAAVVVFEVRVERCRRTYLCEVA